MQEKIYISERQEGFRAHQSLTDKPLVFETSRVKGAIFYLPFEQPLGGDSFTVKADDYLAVSLLEDMTGEGIKAREKLKPHLINLELITDAASLDVFEKEKLLKEIIKLDTKLDPYSLIAFSLVRLFNDGTVYYLNIGENKLMICKEGKTLNFSDMSHGKIGILNLVFGSEEEIMKQINIYQKILAQKDKVLLCSDDVLEYIKDSEYIAKRTNEVETILALPEDISSIVSKINSCAMKELRKRKIEKIEGDYTIIGLQLK